MRRAIKGRRLERRRITIRKIKENRKHNEH